MRHRLPATTLRRAFPDSPGARAPISGRPVPPGSMTSPSGSCSTGARFMPDPEAGSPSPGPRRGNGGIGDWATMRCQASGSSPAATACAVAAAEVGRKPPATRPHGHRRRTSNASAACHRPRNGLITAADCRPVLPGPARHPPVEVLAVLGSCPRPPWAESGQGSEPARSQVVRAGQMRTIPTGLTAPYIRIPCIHLLFNLKAPCIH